MRLWTVSTALALCGAFVAAPAVAQSRGERIEVLEAQVVELERKLQNQGLLEMQRQLATQEAELRRMRGEVEKLQHELERSRTQQRDQYVDLDARLKAAEIAVAAGPASAAPSAGPDADYQAAIQQLRDGQYDTAAAAFNGFLARYKDHELASNALYWLGETHYVRRDYPAALAAFEGVLADYPGARKSPDALLKAGYCQQELKRYDLARAALTRVTQDYAGTPAAAEAATRLERLAAENR